MPLKMQLDLERSEAPDCENGAGLFGTGLSHQENKRACFKYICIYSIQVEPGKPGAEVSKKKNYKSKKEFAYRMCTG